MNPKIPLPDRLMPVACQGAARMAVCGVVMLFAVGVLSWGRGVYASAIADEDAETTFSSAMGTPIGSRAEKDLAPTSCTLTVLITNLRPGRHPVGLLVFDKDAGFPTRTQRATRRAWVLPDDAATTSVQVIVPRLPPGRYAVSVFQDTNGNRSLDRSLFGRPVEPYGFSGEPPKRFGPPRFKEAAIVLPDGYHHLEIRLSDGQAD